MSKPRRKRLGIALLLQCLPLIAAGNCVGMGMYWHPQDAGFWYLILMAPLFGLGYLYLGDLKRLLFSLVAGVLLSVLLGYIYLASLVGIFYSHRNLPEYERIRAMQSDITRTAFMLALLLAAGVLVTALEAAILWRRSYGRRDTAGMSW